MSIWINIKDGFPTESGCYLCYKVAKSDFNFAIRFYSKDINRFLTCENEIDELSITHWMELPIPPLKDSYPISDHFDLDIQL